MMLYRIILKSNVMDNKFNYVKLYNKKSVFLHLWCTNVFRSEAQGDWGIIRLNALSGGYVATHIPQFLPLGMFHF